MHTFFVKAGLVLLLLATGACQAPGPSPVPKEQFTGLFRDMADCRDDYKRMDAKVAEAGVGNAAYHRIPGYPYLRTDRLTASFIDEVDTFNEINGWLRRMRELDQEAREFEYMNLGLSLRDRANYRDRMLNCGKTLAALEINSPEKLAQLKNAIRLSDDYSTVQRALGIYPAAVPLLKARLSEQRQKVRNNHQRLLAGANVESATFLWKATKKHDPSLIPANLDQQFTDELGVPGLTTSGWKALVESHAPNLWVDANKAFGAPRWTETGAAVDTQTPTVFYHIDYTRFGGEVLVQLNYFIWFAGGQHIERGAPIDGIVWRVTLDRQGQALVYDSMHISGRDHRWYPVQDLKRRPVASFWQQSPFFPSEELAPNSAALHIGTGAHALQSVARQTEPDTQHSQRYKLKRYETLLALPLPEGGTRSLFNGEGRIRQTRVSDPVWLWASGISPAGALRQYGHHPTSYIGREYFDDPFLLEKVFIPEQGESEESAQADRAPRPTPHQTNWARHH